MLSAGYTGISTTLTDVTRSSPLNDEPATNHAPNRPWLFFQKVEWSCTASVRPNRQNQRQARFGCTSWRRRRPERMPKQLSGQRLSREKARLQSSSAAICASTLPLPRSRSQTGNSTATAAMR